MQPQTLWEAHGRMECETDVEGTDLQQGMLAEKGRRKAWVRPRFASCARCACCSLMRCRKQCMRVACMSAWGCCCQLALSISSAPPQIGSVRHASTTDWQHHRLAAPQIGSVRHASMHYERGRVGHGWEGMSCGGKRDLEGSRGQCAVKSHPGEPL